MRDYKPQAEKNALERGLQTFAQTPFGGKLFIGVFPAIDRKLIPLTRGKLSTGMGQTFLLLHTTGAKSGVERTNPLLATKRQEQILLVASKAGAPKHPGWLYNVRAQPDVEATFDGVRHPMRARIIDAGPERDELWEVVCDHYSGYATYQQRAGDRLIPVVELTARAG
jgi:deazaflavin-dependent oxidoreductase (nitroreductase family)